MSKGERPPRLATALLRLVVPRGWTGDSLEGDLEEEFVRRRTRSALRARLWYGWAVVQIAAAYLVHRLRAEGRTAPRAAGPGGGPPHPPHEPRATARPGSHVLQDLRFALRGLRRAPAFTVVAATTLALGIGAATAMFSVADTVLLRPLPFSHSDRLVHVWVTRPRDDEWRGVVSGATFLDWKRDADAFEGIAAYRRIDYNLQTEEQPERVSGVSITTDFFRVLRPSVALGRLPTPDDEASAAGAVVLSDALWRRRFGADPGVIGASLTLNGEPHPVVAVLPRAVGFPERTELYVVSPFRVPADPLSSQDLSTDRGAGYLSVVARLADGVSLEAAQAEVNVLSEALARDYPDTKANEGAVVVALRDDLVRDLRPTLLLLLGAVGLVLFIACANVANLLTVRASRRRQELALRISLGAGLGRIRRQLLTESVVLALCGGVPAFLLASWGTRLVVALAPDRIPRLTEVGMNTGVFAFGLLATLVTGLAFGLAPMVGLEEGTAASTLRGTGRRGRARPDLLRSVVVVTEVALSLLLVVGAGLMIRTFRALDRADPGFDPSDVLVAHVSLPQPKYEETERQAAFYAASLEKIGAIPGVVSASSITTLPMHWAIRGTLIFEIEGRPSDPEQPPLAAYQPASPGYFRTLRIPLLRGRDFEASDREDAPPVAVINDAAARRYWPDADPLGARITFWGDADDPDTEWATIVGVVGNTVKEGLDRPPEPEVFLPVGQVALSRASFVVRTQGDPYAVAAAVRGAVQSVDPQIPLYGLLSMEDVLADSLAQRRFRMQLLGGFAAAALLLAAIGLYGVVSYSVSQRTREIGIRMALGAERHGVIGHVVRDGLGLVTLGLVIGVGASLGLRRLVAGQVFGVRATDPATYVGAALLLLLVAFLACLVPAARAARVNPVAAVRDS